MKDRYPTVRVSECEHFDSYSNPIGFRFCEKCNSIILFCPHLQDEAEWIEDNICLILSHESLHWVLFKEIGERACSDLDKICEEVL